MRFIYLTKRETNFRLLLITFIVALSFACNKSEAESARQENANNTQGNTEAAVTITVDKAVAREIPAFIQATGSLVADETSDIAPKTAGKVVNVSVNVGNLSGKAA